MITLYQHQHHQQLPTWQEATLKMILLKVVNTINTNTININNGSPDRRPLSVWSSSSSPTPSTPSTSTTAHLARNLPQYDPPQGGRSLRPLPRLLSRRGSSPQQLLHLLQNVLFCDQEIVQLLLHLFRLFYFAIRILYIFTRSAVQAFPWRPGLSLLPPLFRSPSFSTLLLFCSSRFLSISSRFLLALCSLSFNSFLLLFSASWKC